MATQRSDCTDEATWLEGQRESNIVRPDVGFGTEVRGRYRFRLLKRLGRGAFGSVFLARCLDRDARRDDSPPETVAVKILGPTAQARGNEMLKRELAALLSVEHDRIPRVYDWSFEGEHAFVAMQHFPGGSLRDVLPQQGPLPEAACWRLLGDLLSALDVAHQQSVLHLDIKPANVLRDADGGFVLTDFGVSQASRLGRGLLPFGVGTRGYQAPEQRAERFDQYDLRTDLWGVGATVWAMATGIHLAEHEELVRDEEDVAYGLPALSDHCPGCSPELERVVMSMLHADPQSRPGSVGEVQANIHALTAASPGVRSSVAAAYRGNLDDAEVAGLVDSLVDPLLLSICGRKTFRSYFVKFEDGEPLCREGEPSAYSFLLLRGTVLVTREGREIIRVERQGSFLGEVATLSNLFCTSTLTASGTVWAVVLNAAELERFLTSNPAMALRMIRSMAYRLSRAPRPAGARPEEPPPELGPLRGEE